MVDDNSCQLMGLGVTSLLDHVLKGDAINPLIYDAIIPKTLLVHLSSSGRISLDGQRDMF